MKLQEVRKQAGMSQSELAEASGVKVRTIQEYEYGRRKLDNAGIDTLLGIAEALKVPMSALLEDAQLAEKVKKNAKREV